MSEDEGPFADALKRARIVDNNLEREKVTVKITDATPLIPQFPIAELETPNYSGVQKAALKTSSALISTSGLTTGSVLFFNGTDIAQDNANLFWDDTNNRLGIGTTSPNFLLDVSGSVNATTLSGSVFKGGTFSGSTIWGTTVSGSAIRTIEDHTISGSSAVVGIITHTSPTPPTASNYPQGTLYIQYTA